MTETHTVGPGREPLVAVVCNVPLLCEALSGALDGIADVRRFKAGGGDTAGLLRWLRPDAVVVDSDAEGEAAAEYAAESPTPVIRVSYRDGAVQVLGEDGWSEPQGNGASAEAIRNVLVAHFFGRVSL